MNEAITTASLTVVILIIAARDIGQAAYHFLQWPDWLVRRLDRSRRAEVQRVLNELGLRDDERALLAEVETRRRVWSRAKYSGADAKSRAIKLISQVFTATDVSVGRTYGTPFPYFVDVYGASLKPDFAQEASSVMVSHLKGELPEGGFKQVVGLKEGSPLLAAEVARRLDLPLCLHRGKDPKPVGVAGDRRFDGDPSAVATLVVDDSATGGRKVLACIEDLASIDANVSAVLVLFEPIGKDARTLIEQNGARFVSVVQMTPDIVKVVSSQVR